MGDIAELYDLRSRIVHEGIAGNKKDAERTVDIARKFLRLIDSVIKLLRNKITSTTPPYRKGFAGES
jgi:hypothetical protein